MSVPIGSSSTIIAGLGLFANPPTGSRPPTYGFRMIGALDPDYADEKRDVLRRDRAPRLPSGTSQSLGGDGLAMLQIDRLPQLMGGGSGLDPASEALDQEAVQLVNA
ncbi:MAG TPA: hypothetical protein VM347_20855, partial [Nonomuraea sp.]|nr:hypothetical protein [Nonomuraea sp.]